MRLASAIKEPIHIGSHHLLSYFGDFQMRVRYFCERERWKSRVPTEIPWHVKSDTEPSHSVPFCAVLPAFPAASLSFPVLMRMIYHHYSLGKIFEKTKEPG